LKKEGCFPKKAPDEKSFKQKGLGFAIKALAFPVGLCQDCAGQRSRVKKHGLFFPKEEKDHDFPSIAALCFL